MAQEFEILDFWFGHLTEPDVIPKEKAAFWFTPDPKVDEEIKTKFAKDLERAKDGKLEHWSESPRGCLALILLLDQIPRNIFRGKSEAFAYDRLAQKTCLEGLAKGFDEDLYPVHRAFFYMPLEHSEDRQLQEASVYRFGKLNEIAGAKIKQEAESFYSYAVEHKQIIEKFGRFPHRNRLLGRENTEAEEKFLNSPELPNWMKI